MDSTDFDCPLCLKLLVEPISLTCGHTFCRGCLTRALSLHPNCPMCRQNTFVTPRDQPVNFVLAVAIPKVPAPGRAVPPRPPPFLFYIHMWVVTASAVAVARGTQRWRRLVSY